MCGENENGWPTYKKKGETSVIWLICYTEGWNTIK